MLKYFVRISCVLDTGTPLPMTGNVNKVAANSHTRRMIQMVCTNLN